MDYRNIQTGEIAPGHRRRREVSNMATLHLVKTENGEYYLQGTGDSSRNADFSMYDWDGEGGDPFTLACGQTWEIVDIPGNGAEYAAEDPDSLWEAQAQIVAAAKQAGIDVPDYVD